ncbi:efflux RND transporter permease subunit, partial [Salmonella enterica subsp. enterica serovar Kentucky]|nr:efflux RND transporter permease subunit [Salmonella enterica subsp. enterica serovar Kentucky]
VQADEQLLESARREAEEELGIAGVPFAEHGLFYFEDPHCRVCAEMRHAMGIAVFAGMLGVTLFGLLLTPVFYVVVRRMALKRE